MRIGNIAALIAWIACAAPDPGGKVDPRQTEVAEARKLHASAVALDAVSLEAEKSYLAALSGPLREDGGVSQIIESVTARRALNELELALVNAPADGPLDRSARRFAAAAENLLLRVREPSRRSADGGLQQTGTLQSLLATHELFQDTAAHLRVEITAAVRSRALIEAMRAGREKRD